MPKKNLFYGANIPYKDIAVFCEQDAFKYFVIQPLISDGDKSDDNYIVALWAVNDAGEVMNGTNPVCFPPNEHLLKAKKKIYFANVYLDKSELEELFKAGKFTLGLAPVPFSAQQEYTSYEIFNADKDIHSNYITLYTANPSPPYKRISQ